MLTVLKLPLNSKQPVKISHGHISATHYMIHFVYVCGCT